MTSEVTKPATCTEKGETTYTSDSFENIRFDFQEKTVDDIPALGHDYTFTEWTWRGNETDGYTEATIHYECCGDGCEQTQQLVVEPKEIRIEPTCTEGGKTIYGAEISEAKAYDDVARNDKMEAKHTDPLGHDWGEWVVTKEATGTEEGSETRTCARCKETETREIPPIPVRYKITLINKNVWGGTISVDKTRAGADDEVTVTVRPKGTYSPWVTVRSTRYGSIYIKDLEMTGKKNTFTGSFSMPAYPVKVIVDFTRAGVQEPEQDAVLMA